MNLISRFKYRAKLKSFNMNAAGCMIEKKLCTVHGIQVPFPKKQEGRRHI